MLRFIVKRRRRLVCGAEVESLHNFDSVSELEKCLTEGGFAEDIYDFSTLVGVEIIEDK